MAAITLVPVIKKSKNPGLIMCANPSCPLRESCRRATTEPTVNQVWKYYWFLNEKCDEYLARRK